MRNLIYILLLGGILLTSISSCSMAGKNNAGSEYMPDMVHSVAYEANYYDFYKYNRWGTEEEYYQFALPKGNVEGTVSRTSSSSINVPGVDARPYDFGDSEAERLRAMSDLINNPYPITDAGLAKGKELYNIYCGICHGDKGDGGGYLVRDDGGKYPVQPANFLLDEHVNASNGRYYHTIMYGRNLMGNYRDKLSYEERWQVIHYIRSLQAKHLKKDYSQLVNTLNTVDVPAGKDYMKNVIEKAVDAVKEVHNDHGHGTSMGETHHGGH